MPTLLKTPILFYYDNTSLTEIQDYSDLVDSSTPLLTKEKEKWKFWRRWGLHFIVYFKRTHCLHFHYRFSTVDF